MSFFILFSKGLAIGLVIAAPVGPIGFLCITRTLEQGAVMGLFTGLGAAAADAVYGAVAAFGLMQLALSLSENQALLRIFGGLALCVIGARALLAADRLDAGNGKNRMPGAKTFDLPDGRMTPMLIHSFFSAFLLTLANPATILSFVAVFAALGWAEEIQGRGAAAVLVAGVFLGSALWWLGLSGVTGLLRAQMGDRQRLWVQRLSGMAILGFGLFAMLSVML